MWTTSSKRSGLVSVGHLLASKPSSAHFQTMRHFCTMVFCNLHDDDAIYKESGFWRYDQFFKSVDVSVDSFSKFVNGILRKHDADELALQLCIEKLAWDLVKFDYDRYVTEAGGRIDRKCVLFRLFCLFNRFCAHDRLPMAMPDTSTFFLLGELGLPLPGRGRPPFTFPDLVEHVVNCRDLLDVRVLKRLYDEYVRDVIKEGRVNYRVLDKNQRIVGTRAGDLPSSQRRGLKTVAVTSRNLVVFEDDGCLDQPCKFEPSGKILLRVPLLDTETRVIRINGRFGGSGKVLLQVLSKSLMVPTIELTFDPTRDPYELYAWSRAVEEAAESTNQNVDRLTKTYIKLGYGGVGRVSMSASRLMSEKHRNQSGPLSLDEDDGHLNVGLAPRSSSDAFLDRTFKPPTPKFAVGSEGSREDRELTEEEKEEDVEVVKERKERKNVVSILITSDGASSQIEEVRRKKRIPPTKSKGTGIASFAAAAAAAAATAAAAPSDGVRPQLRRQEEYRQFSSEEKEEDGTSDRGTSRSRSNSNSSSASNSAFEEKPWRKDSPLGTRAF